MSNKRHQVVFTVHAKGFCLQETSIIHLGVWGGGGGLAAVTFLCGTSWEHSIFVLKILDFLETFWKGI